MLDMQNIELYSHDQNAEHNAASHLAENGSSS